MKCVYCYKKTQCDLYVLTRKNKTSSIMQGFCYLCIKALCQGLNIKSKNKIISILPKFEDDIK